MIFGILSIPLFTSSKIRVWILKRLIFKYFSSSRTDNATYCEIVGGATNKLGDKFFLRQTKKPSMLPSERKLLKEIYETEVRNLEELLGSKLPWDDFRGTS